MKLNKCTKKAEFKIGPIISYKDLLLDILKKKNVIIKHETGIDYITDADLSEIRQYWSEADCKLCLISMNRRTDADACPWCILHSPSCHSCGYRQRHGKCDSGDSTYYKIRRRSYMNITSFPHMDELYRTKSKIVNGMRQLEEFWNPCKRSNW